jgi:hypothetical protein
LCVRETRREFNAGGKNSADERQSVKPKQR